MSGYNNGRVLLADDDHDDQYLVRSALTRISTSVSLDCVDGGLALLDYLQDSESNPESQLPDLILLDLNMPDLSGMEVLKRIKQSESFCRIPAIVFTTSQSCFDIESSYKNGANTYIVKPLDFDELVETIRVVIDYWFNTAKRTENTSAL